MAGGLHKWGLPVLPVLVVSVTQGMPSETVLSRFGWWAGGDALRTAEVYDFDWPGFFFGGSRGR